MDVMNTFLSEQTIQQIGWVLVHFLWQGCAVMALIWCIMKVLGKASANMRYIIACFGLGLMALSPVATFLAMEPSDGTAATGLEHFQSAVASAPKETIDNHQEIAVSYVEPIVHERRLQDVLSSRIETALPYCVMGWVLGVGGLSLWYLGGWCQLQKLRRVGTKTVSDAIKEKTLELAQRLGIRRAVHVAESVLIQAPTVIGWLEPMILLPVSALTGLDEVQLKALIAHELAHIKRCDYIVNITQTVIEILGFYHPAVWWVSCQVRLERENCCDDMAVALLRDRKEYARALFSMEEIRSRQLDLAVAANGGRLENRIERLIGKKSTQHEKPGWIPIAVICGLMTALIFSVAVTAQTPGESGEKILRFPTEYCLGRILIQNDTLERNIQTFQHWIDNAPWEPLGPAMGDVRIPAGKRVQLMVYSIAWETPEKLAPLKSLKADDLYSLIIGAGWTAPVAAPPTDKCIPYIQHLTGLKVLDLSGTAITQQGLKLLSNMKRLERIGVPDNLTNGGLATLVKMQSLKAIYLSRHQLSDKGVGLLTQLPHLEELVLSGKGLTDEGLSHLSGLTSLDYLILNDGRFSPKGFTHIAAIPNLRILWINTENCGDEGLRELARHPKLERLSVHWLKDITDQGIHYVSQMPSLKKLDVGSANLTNQSLEYLSQNKNLEWLCLPAVGYTNKGEPIYTFTNEGIAHLAKLQNLKHLTVSASSGSPLADPSLFAISRLSGLEELWIGGTGFTDAGMKELSKLKSLKELLISAAPAVTDEGLAYLSSLYNLESFNWMGNSKVTFEGLNRLDGLKKLKRLDCLEIQRGAATLSLVGMESLEDLRLSLPRKFDKKNLTSTFTESFSDADISCISGLKKLSYLSLCGNGIGNAGLEYLSGLNNLETVFLYGQSRITDDGLKNLSGLNRLWQLHIKDGRFTDKALETLVKSDSLEMLELTSDTAFSDPAVKEFRAKKKNLQQLKLDVNADGRQSNRDSAYGGIAVGPNGGLKK